MKQISGNKLLVKALKEEGVDTLFGYPGACTIDISDELYKQMLLNSSPEFSFSSSEEGNLRYVDFSERNPSPKILTIADYDKIMSSGCLFARKFDIHKDKRVVEKILESL